VDYETTALPDCAIPLKEHSMTAEKWLSPKQIAEQYNVSYETARRWIKRVLGDDVRMSPRYKSGKRPYRLRRVPESLLEEHLPELLNG
jgi:transposase